MNALIRMDTNLPTLHFKRATDELGHLINMVQLNESNHTYTVAGDSRKYFESASSYMDKLYSSFRSKWSGFSGGAFSMAMANMLRKEIYHYYKYGELINVAFVDDNCFKQFLAFETWRIKKTNWIPYISELCMRDVDWPLCGTLNMLFLNGESTDSEDKSTHVNLVSWKQSSKNFNQKYRGHGLGPLRHERDTRLNRYTLQLNIYKYMLENPNNGYNMTVDNMYIIQFDEAGIGYMNHPIESYSKDKIEEILAYVPDEPTTDEDSDDFDRFDRYDRKYSRYNRYSKYKNRYSRYDSYYKNESDSDDE